MTSPTINAERLRRRLAALVQVPSLTGQEQAAIDLVESWLRETGAHVERWTASMQELERDPEYPGREVEREAIPLVAARVEGGLPGPTVLLTGHVDVVPVGDPDQWTRAPFGAQIDADHLYGRGACDMKAGVVAALEAFCAFAAHEEPFAGAVCFVAVPGEEDGGTGTLAAIRRGWRADAVIVTEPTARGDAHPDIIIAHGGALTFTVTLEGRSAHACKRLEGESALEHYLALHQAMRDDEADTNDAERDPLIRALGLPYPTCVGKISGGVWSSSVMDHLEVEVRVGVAVGETTEHAARRFRTRLLERAAQIPWLRDHPPKIERTGAAFASARLDADHALVHALREAARALLGDAPALAAAPYGCDMAMWTRAGDCPTLVYGPGDVRLAHAPDERVSLTQTEDVARVLVETIRRLSNPQPLPQPAAPSTPSRGYGAQSMVEPLREVLLVPPPQGVVPDSQYTALGWTAPNERLLKDEFDAFRALLEEAGVEVHLGEPAPTDNPDAIYAYDSVLVTNAGAILLRPGKANRRQEPAQRATDLEALGIPIMGRVEPPGLIEAGDLLWVNETLLWAGLGWRTNTEGVQQLQELLRPLGVTIEAFDLPNAHGRDECLHLMSLISLIRPDLAVVNTTLLPVRVVQRLEARGVQLIEASNAEYDTLGTNVLVLGTNTVVLLDVNAQVRDALVAHGVTVLTMEGAALCIAGTGGPTCLTRPLRRG